MYSFVCFCVFCYYMGLYFSFRLECLFPFWKHFLFISLIISSSYCLSHLLDEVTSDTSGLILYPHPNNSIKFFLAYRLREDLLFVIYLFSCFLKISVTMPLVFTVFLPCFLFFFFFFFSSFSYSLPPLYSLPSFSPPSSLYAILESVVTYFDS